MDLKILMVWFIGRATLRVLHLELWQRKIHQVEEKYDDIQIIHIENNSMVDMLLEEASILDASLLSIS